MICVNDKIINFSKKEFAKKEWSSGIGITLKMKEHKIITKSKSKLNFGALPYPNNNVVSIRPNISKLINAGFNQFTPFNEAIENIINYKRILTNEKN